MEQKAQGRTALGFDPPNQRTDPMTLPVLHCRSFVVPKDGHMDACKPDDLRDFCRQQGLVNWKIPREIKVVQDFPRSPTGKVLKRQLAEQAGG